MSFSAERAVTVAFHMARTTGGAQKSLAARKRGGACRGRRGVYSYIPAVFFSFFFTFTAWADIFIEPQIGFHGVFQLGRPFPLEVRLANSGRPADGLLEIQVWKGGAARGAAPYPTFHRREVFLPARSQRTVRFTIDPDFLSRPLRIRFSSPSVAASREFDLRRYFSPAPIVLSVSERNALSLASWGASPTASRVVALSLAELPAESRALLGVSHIIFYEQSLRDLSRAQFLALDDWLAAGGQMVIVGSVNFTLYQEPQLARYLPVRVTGVKRYAFSSSREMAEDQAIADVWTQIATVVRGKAVLESSEGLPLIVENAWGRGKVTYLSLDAGRPPLSAWTGLPKFLRSLLIRTQDEQISNRPQWSEGIFTQLLLSPSFISAYIPTGSLFFAIIGYLAGIGALGWLWQRRLVARRALTLCCGGWIFLTAAAGYFFFSRGGQVPDGVLLEATLLENAGEGYVEAQTNLALFSTQIREYHLALGRGWMDLVPLATPAYGQVTPALVYHHGAGVTRLQLPLKEWGFKLLRARYVDRLALSTAIERHGDRLLLKVQNRSGKDLTDCWLVIPGRRISLGELGQGESWTKTIPLASGDGGARAQGRSTDELPLREITFDDKTRNILFHTSFFPRDRDAMPWRGNVAVFFGWLKQPDPWVAIGDPRIGIRSYALYRLMVPLGETEEE